MWLTVTDCMLVACACRWYLLRVVIGRQRGVVTLLNLLTQRVQVHLVSIEGALQGCHLNRTKTERERERQRERETERETERERETDRQTTMNMNLECMCV